MNNNPDYSAMRIRKINKPLLEPKEVVERRRLRELKERRDGELLKNADRVASSAVFFIKILGVSVIVDLFYWLLGFTSHDWLIKYIGPFCTGGEIISILALICILFYSLITGSRICKFYDALVLAYNQEMVSEVGW